MEISKEFVEKLTNILNSYYDTYTKEYELEAKIKTNITKDVFNYVINYYMSVLNIDNVVPIKRLDVFDDTYNRVSIETDDNIKKYCMGKTQELNEKIITKKNIQGIKPLVFDEIDNINFKIDLKKEQVIKKLSKKFDIKNYRLKEIYSIINKNLKYDFSIVKEYDEDNFLKEEVDNKYEIEIEVIHDENKLNPKDFLYSILELCLAIINDDGNMINKKEQIEIFEEYFNFIYPTKNIEDAKKNPKSYFPGPQPVTLMKKNIIPKGVDNTSIQENYTITEKADGERMLLYFNNKGNCYLVNNRLKFIKLNITNIELKNSIFDGEYITETKSKNKLYGIFDVYYLNGNIVANKPLISNDINESRLNIIKNSIKKINNKTIFAKQFKYGNDIFKESKDILNSIKADLYDYKTDGIIFTPKDLIVGADFANDEYKLGGTWRKTFKWKPAEDNTIDFLVKTNKGEIMIDNKLHKVLTLYSGYNPAMWDPLTVYKFITSGFEKEKNKKNLYIKKEFIPSGESEDVCLAYIEIDNDMVYAKNKDIINDNSIVEFSYDQKNKKWIPLRVRKDKTELLKFGLSGTANDYSTAISIWQTIKRPITYEMITGDVKLTRDDIEEDDIYYYRTTTRDKFASINMLTFHNKYIKSMLFSKLKGKGTSLMDISCGKGGDLNKFLLNGFKKVFGSDIKKDNIENPQDGVYARLIDNRNYKPKVHNYVFAPLDASKKFSKEYFNSIQNTDDRNALQLLAGLDQKYTQNKYFGFINEPFDVISCQFTIHYFFDKEEHLDNVVWNINKYLKPGGYFIGTTMDGKKVEKLLEKNDEVTSKIGDKVIWNIRKNYDDNQSLSVDNKKNWASIEKKEFGREIYVYMESIGIETKEYLFDFDTLVEKLKFFDIHLLDNKELKKLKLENSYENFSQEYDRQAPLHEDIKLNDEEKRFSFLNMWFIFQKKNNNKNATTSQK